MRRLAILAAATLAATTLTAAPAHAVYDCTADIFCGAFKHASPDAGYDAPFRVRCHPGPRGTPFWVRLAEGERTADIDRCIDVDRVRLLAGTQLHCDQIGNPFDSRRVWWLNPSSRTQTYVVTMNKSLACTNQLVP